MILKEEISRIGVKCIFNRKYNFTFSYENFDPRRKAPYFLVSNHASLHDPLYVGMNLKYCPYPVASNLLYTKPVMRFALTKIVTSIPKRKSQSDIQTIRYMLKAFKDKKRGIMIFPEGNSSFFGEQTKTDFLPTAKIIKKIGADLIYARIDGGYLASPRWGKYRKKAPLFVHYKRLLDSTEIAKMSVEDIVMVLEKSFQFNDYDWNRIHMHTYRSNHLAEGLERYIYVCPKCHQGQTISTKDNDIFCSSCGKIAHINHHSFLEGLPFDNLVEWGNMQIAMLGELVKKKLVSGGLLFNVDFKKNKQIKLGYAHVELSNNILSMKTNDKTYSFPVIDIKGIAITQRNDLSFDYKQETYLVKLEHCKLFLDAINYIKGEQEKWENGA